MATKDGLLSLRKHWRIGLIGTVISVLAIYFISRQLDLDVLSEALAEARFIYVLPGVLLLLIGLVTRALRWRLLLSGGLPLFRTFNIMTLAYLINGLVPLRIGELVRIYLASRGQDGVPPFKCASTVIVERVLDMLTVVLLIAIVLASGPVPAELHNAGLIIGAVTLAGFLFLVYFSRRRELAQRILAIFTGRIAFPSRFNLAGWLDHSLEGLRPLAKVNTLLLALLWTAISWFFSVSAGYVLMLTFYPDGSWAAAALFIAATSLAIAVPAVPGNLGKFEVSVLLALGALGYGEPVTVATAFAVMVHAVILVLHAVTGLYGFVQEGVSLSQLSQGVQHTVEAEPGHVNASNQV
jgi:glycosyltransferase 2 family protein